MAKSLPRKSKPNTILVNTLSPANSISDFAILTNTLSPAKSASPEIVMGRIHLKNIGTGGVAPIDMEFKEGGKKQLLKNIDLPGDAIKLLNTMDEGQQPGLFSQFLDYYLVSLLKPGELAKMEARKLAALKVEILREMTESADIRKAIQARIKKAMKKL